MSSPNVLLLVLDSVRARNTSLHGHHNETTPFLESFAAEQATVYEQARAPSEWSLPSHASMFTGHHVTQHKLTERGRQLRPEASVWSDLRDSAYATGLFSSNPYLTELPTGLDAGFETVRGSQDLPYPDAMNPRQFVEEHGSGAFLTYVRACAGSDAPIQAILNGISEKLSQDAPKLLPASLRGVNSAETYAELFLDWQAEQNGPWAACINFMDAHTPYTPGPDHDRWGGEQARSLQNAMDNQIWEFYGDRRPWWHLAPLEGLYDGAIHRIDEQLRRIVETLQSRDAFENTLLVVTADHGEGFGDQSLLREDFRVVGHQARGVEEPLLHVPLVVKRPGQRDPETVSTVASLTRFPAEVTDAQNGTTDGRAFVPDGPVLASTYGLTAQKRSVATDYLDDLDVFSGVGHARYHGSGDSVTRDAAWDGTEVTSRSYDARTTIKIEESDRPPVSQTIASLPDRNVQEAAAESVDADTKRRLEELGYA